mmetsp:Transcript_6575/g.17373  ORF Transcript_6575/g.17373 Transcript_6575/m.17373 type:complete len:183 (-) Transcript_6575:290-838(-)
MLASMKASAKAAGDATERAAKRTKLLGEIELLASKITTAKKDFGKAVYDAMCAQDQAGVTALFNDVKQKIDEMEAKIAEKKARIEELKLPADKRGSTEGDASMHPPYGAPPPGAPPGYGAPPPGAPPGYGAPVVQGAPVPPPTPPPGGPPLPPGWKKATTPEGRDYYYHGTTGETSWTIPAA